MFEENSQEVDYNNSYDFVKEQHIKEDQHIIDKYLSRYDDESGPWYWEKE